MMRRLVWCGATMVAVAVMCVGRATPVSADGVMLPPKEALRQFLKSVVYEPEQKAVIVFRDGVEDLIISPRFSGPVSRFAWIIPVPTRPKVDRVGGALFHEIARLTFEEQRSLYAGKTRGPVERAAAQVQVLERKQVGAYDVAVLTATGSGALMAWLRDNRFAVPEAAEQPLQQHIKEGWTFVAARVKVPAAASRLGEGTLAPIRLTFRTREPVYPLRVSSANPRPFFVEVFLILPTRDPSVTHTVHVRHPGDRRARPANYCWKGVPDARKTPTLAALIQGPCAIYEHSNMYEPRLCRADLRFAFSERTAVPGPGRP